MDSDFRYLKLGQTSRLVLAGGLFLLGGALELALGRSFPGILLAALGWLPLALRTASNRPDDQGLEEWRAVGLAELDRLDDAIRESKKLGKRLNANPRGCLIAALFPLGFLVVVAGGLIGGGADLIFLGANALVFLLPPLFFGGVRVFLPREIEKKIPSFRAVLAEAPPAGVSIVPYFRFDKDPEGRDIPEDLRLMIESKRKPQDFVGIQLQVAINKGPNGQVPYLYAVVLCRGMQGPAYRAASRLAARGFELEAGGDEEYGTVVLRQETSGGGYHTTPDDCRELARLCYGFLAGL